MRRAPQTAPGIAEEILAGLCKALGLTYQLRQRGAFFYGSVRDAAGEVVHGEERPGALGREGAARRLTALITPKSPAWVKVCRAAEESGRWADRVASARENIKRLTAELECAREGLASKETQHAAAKAVEDAARAELTDAERAVECYFAEVEARRGGAR